MFTPLLLTCLLLGAPEGGAPATQPADGAQVDALIADLASPEWGTRRKAMQALRAMGSDARAALTQALQSDDAEVRALAEKLLAEISEQDLIEETRVSLKLDKVSAGEALAALEKEIGFKFAVEPDNWEEFGQRARVSVDLVDVPLLDAVREVIPRCGLSVPEHGQGQLWAWGDVGWPAFPTARNGAMQIEARTITINHHASVNLAHQAEEVHTNATIGFLVMVEPKLKTMGRPTIVLESIVDDAGNEMNIPGEQDFYHHHGEHGGLLHYVTQPLDLTLEGGPDAIARLAGRVNFNIERDSDEFVIDDPLTQGGSKRYKQTQLVVGELTQSNDGFRVTVNINNAGQITSDHAFLRGLRLEMSDGRHLLPMPEETSEHGWNIEAKLLYHDMPEDGKRDGDDATPVRLVWHVPLALEERSFEFEFKDLN
ncbi:MAG: HEAT repeat domain-containing protein, partial [Planctomycetota bacterium]